MSFKKVNIISWADENLASFRLRQKVIAEWINSNSKEWRVFISERPDESADINLFHKHINKDTVLQWTKLLRENSKSKIMFDISDYWFDDPEYGQFYKDMCKLSDFVTTASQALQEEASKYCEASIIFEPTQLEFITKEQRENKDRPNDLVWIGHGTNLKELLPLLNDERIAGRDLTIISNVHPGIGLPQNIKLLPWKLGIEETLINYKTVLIPQSNKYKSPNRLVDAFYAGCEVEHLGVNECYTPFVYNLLSRLDAGVFSLAGISNDWIDTFNLVLKKERKQIAEIVAEPHPCLKDKKYVKLNLGCGIKIYPKTEGWVNIDIVDNPDLDVKADVRQISKVIGKNVADEVHAYHVVEHIYPQELPAVFRDWLDVLKPGGKLCIELPCFVKAAKNILQLETTGDQTLWMDLGLKAFYGDYNCFSPSVQLDLHKWAWTFKTLKQELEKYGFIDCIEEAPVTHRRERDFRIVCRKRKVNNDN